MNRNETEGKSTNLAHEVALGALPIEIISAGDAPSMDTQAAVDTAVSRATNSKRRWNRKTLAVACGAARPAVARELRSRGKAFTAGDLKNTTKVHVQKYADKHGVVLPPRVVLGKNALEAVAGDICGAFSLHWTDFMPPQVKVAAKAAQEGSPMAQSWLKKYFGHGSSSPAPAAPATPTTPTTPAAKTALAVSKPAETAAADEAGSGDSLGDWMYQLNPAYWLKSAEERKLIDQEKQAWSDNAELQKKIAKRDVVLKQGEKALEAKQAVTAAQARTAEMEAQLKAIQSQLSGACGGIQEILGADKKRNPFDEKPDPFADDVPAYDAAPVLKKIGKARQLNADNSADLAAVAAKLLMNQPLSPDEVSKILLLLSRNEQLHEFRKGLVSGENFSQNPSAAKIQRHVVLGAVKALTPDEQQKLAHIIALAKQSNPNAQKALAALKAQGYAATMGAACSGGPAARLSGKPLTLEEQQKLSQIVAQAKQGNPNAQKALALLQAQGQVVVVGGTMGFGISDAWSIATLPVRGALAATNWTARKLGITKGGSVSPEQARLNRLKAAAKRRQAAQARARAADAQTEAEYRAQQAIASAADAEADASEAEATAKEAAMLTAEAEYEPGVVTQDDGSSSTSQGVTILGATAPVITPLPPTPDTPSVTKLKKVRRQLVAKKNPQAARILAASEENSPAGIKLRASMAMYKAAQNRKSQERKAVAVMVAKAKKGDKQAIADVQALKAAGLAVKAEKQASRHMARVAAYRATSAKVKATQKRLEVAASDKLIQASRRHQLAKVAKIERRASAGDKKCQKIVQHQVAKAKAGDPKAKKAVSALALARHVRTTAPNKREQRNLKQATHLVKKVARGDKRALAQVKVYEAAAKHGNPNAKRAMKRVRTAAAVENAVKTGMFVLPAAVVTSEIAAKREQAKKKERERKIALAEKRLKAGKGTREEVMAAAKAASDGGDKARGAELAAQAATLPSAAEELKRVAAVSAAAGAGNRATQAQIAESQRAAEAGDPAGVTAMGSLAAVKAMDQVSKGKDIDPEMKSAVKDVEAAQAGDPAALQKIATAQEQAKAGVPAAVKYAIYATGAAAVGKALADNPEAKDQWRQKAGLAPVSTENEDVKIAPELVTTSPMSSLPDQPLPPVRGVLGLIKACLQAVALSTRDPFANYREAVASRGRRRMVAADNAGDDAQKASLWSALSSAMRVQKAKVASVVQKLRPVLENIRKNDWKRPYPIVFDQKIMDEAGKRAKDDDTDAKALSQLVSENLVAFSSKGPRISSLNIPEGDAIKGDDSGSALSPREQRILADALKNKTITRDDYELLTSLETNPGDTEKALRGAGVKIVTFGPTAVRGEAKKKAKRDEPSEIDALNELQDPTVKAAIEARKVRPATSSGDKGAQPATSMGDAAYDKALTQLITLRNKAARGDEEALKSLNRLADLAKQGNARMSSLFADMNRSVSATSSSDNSGGPGFNKAVTTTRSKLDTLVNRATAGDKAAQAKWQSVQAAYKQDAARASKGDPNAKSRVDLLRATGHFAV